MEFQISIVIPVYNRADLIKETLTSIAEQSYTFWECIIVDDGSTDGTEHVIKDFVSKDKRFQLYSRPLNLPKGPNACRNFGFYKSKGDFINWFDSDDVYLPEAFMEYSKFFGQDLDAIIPKTMSYDFKNNKELEINKLQSPYMIEDYFTRNINFFGFGPIWRRDFVEQQPYLFDETLTYADDWDFNLRMLYAQPRLKILDNVFIRYRVHENSLSKEARKLNILAIKSDLRAKEKHYRILKLRKDIEMTMIEDYLQKNHFRYLKWALTAKSKYRWFIFKSLLGRLISLKRYKIAARASLGYFANITIGKGYRLLKGL